MLNCDSVLSASAPQIQELRDRLTGCRSHKKQSSSSRIFGPSPGFTHPGPQSPQSCAKISPKWRKRGETPVKATESNRVENRAIGKVAHGHGRNTSSPLLSWASASPRRTGWPTLAGAAYMPPAHRRGPPEARQQGTRLIRLVVALASPHSITVSSSFLHCSSHASLSMKASEGTTCLPPAEDSKAGVFTPKQTVGFLYLLQVARKWRGPTPLGPYEEIDSNRVLRMQDGRRSRATPEEASEIECLGPRSAFTCHPARTCHHC